MSLFVSCLLNSVSGLPIHHTDGFRCTRYVALDRHQPAEGGHAWILCRHSTLSEGDLPVPGMSRHSCCLVFRSSVLEHMILSAVSLSVSATGEAINTIMILT